MQIFIDNDLYVVGKYFELLVLRDITLTAFAEEF